MSKPKPSVARFVRKPRLRSKELCIAAIEEGGKITAFEVRPVDKAAERVDVYRNKVLDAFKKAQDIAAKHISVPTKPLKK